MDERDRNREPGFYWCQYAHTDDRGLWAVFEWNRSFWTYGDDDWDSDELLEIDERRLVRQPE